MVYREFPKEGIYKEKIRKNLSTPCRPKIDRKFKKNIFRAFLIPGATHMLGIYSVHPGQMPGTRLANAWHTPSIRSAYARHKLGICPALCRAHARQDAFQASPQDALKAPQDPSKTTLLYVTVGGRFPTRASWGGLGRLLGRLW